MVADLRYFSSLEHEEYYYADHMNAIRGVYTTFEEFTDLQCDYVDQVVKCERLEKELSKCNTTLKSFEALQQHAIDLELALQQYLKAQLLDKNIALCELKKLYEKLKGKSVETKFEKPSVIRQLNAFRDQRSFVLGVIPTTSVSRPQLKSNQLEDRVMPNNSQGKKQEVEDHQEVYMKQPKGFVMPGNEHKVCKLVKSLYGLKQAPKQWHQKFDEVVLSSGFLLNQSDKYVYSKFDISGKCVIICLYVDDMLIFGTNQNQVDKTKKFLSSRFSMKDMGEADVILGIKIKRENKGIVITQSHYSEKILKKFNCEDCSPVSTPMDPVEKVKPNTGKPVDQLKYSRAIGCLMYAMTSTRPDIAYAVARLSKFTSNPSRQHWQAIIRVFKYLKVPTGRVVVPTGRYVVPAGKVIIIVSPGRLSLVPTGRVLSPGSKDLSRVGSNTFLDTHNMVAFLEKLAESDGFHEIIDFLNANQIRYALTVNPTIYTSCIEQFWATTKVNTVNGERGIDCLPTATIFEELARMGYEKPSPKLTFYKAFFSPQWKFLIHTILQCLSAKTTAWNEFSSTMASAIICLATNQKFNMSKYIFDAMLGDMSHHKKIYVNPSHTKKIFANMKREGKDFSGRVTPLRKQTKNTEVPHTSDSTADVPNEEHVPTHSHDPLLSGEDRMKLTELMDMCTKLSEKVLDLEHTKTAQAQEITNLKLRVKKLEKKAGLRTHKFKRLYKVGVTRRVASSDDEGLGAQEDASKQGRSRIEAIDRDAEVTLVDETQEMNDDNLMFDTDVLEEQEKDVAEKEVSTADPVTTAGEVVTTANVEVTTVKAPTTNMDELTLAQTLIEIKAAKPKAVTSAATTTTTTRPKARGVVVQEPSEFKTTSSSLQASQLPQAKDKGKRIMVEPEVPLKKKDQLALDEEMARNLEAQLQAELIEEERIARQKEEEANIALLESWDNTQAMMEADFELAQRLQAEEQGEITIEERSRLFVELMEKRKKHFAALRAQEKRSKPPTKAQKRNTMSTYLKNMAGYKHNQLKRKSYDEIQEMFDKEMKRVNTFVDMNTELVKGSKTKAKSSSKRVGNELEQEKSKKQKGDDQEEAEMKRHIKIVKDDEVAIDAIPLATKPPVIVDYKVDKDGRMGYFKLIRADGSSKRYSSMIKMLPGIDREDLETLWKLVKAKYENTRPEDDYERVLWGDLKVMFEPDIKSDVWRNLQGYKVTVWKLFDNCGVHFENNQLPVVISFALSAIKIARLLEVLKNHKEVIAWSIADIKGIDSSFCTQKIIIEDEFKPSVQPQRRVNPNIKEVVKKEVIKLLDAGLIYPISDSPWVSPVQVVPKKGGMTVVKNEKNELIPQRTITRWCVCIDYYKLNNATQKDHFPLSFIDQMLERLAGHEYYCFLDGFSGYFQITIAPEDQEKTLFTYNY
ncbi:putative ribonuclease H-like domain-containing protein [Tanacetum coccineum]